MVHSAGSRPRDDGGFSLMELLIVCLMATTVAAISAGFFRSVKASVTGNANMRKVESLLKLARETAINERRAIQITFTMPNRIRLTRLNLPVGTTQVAEGYLEGNMTFMLFANLPDTPDGFGRNSPIDFGAAAQILFTTEGTLTDQAGNTINGSIYLGQSGTPMTARAMTIFGPTATIRTYRWNGSAWKH